MGILFLIYSCLHVYSATIGDLSTSQNEPLSETLDDTSPNPSYLGNEFYQTTDKTDEVTKYRSAAPFMISSFIYL